jgi:fructose-bisphosphate aldolase class II
MHGLLESMVRGEEHKKLDIRRIAEVKKAAGGRFMTLHGGSGTNAEDFRAAIQAGMTIVHVNTELRLAWRRGIEKGLAENPREIAPYKLLPQAVREMQEVVMERLALFSGK